MKKTHSVPFVLYLFLTGILLFGTMESLQSQEVYKTVDSSYTYKYNSPSDSFLVYKQINHQIDSIQTYFSNERFTWNVEASVWNKERRYNYVLNSKGNFSYEDIFKWDSELNQWYLFYKKRYTFDEDENMTSEVEHALFNGDEFFTGTDSSTYQYDSTGHLTIESHYQWDEVSRIFIPGYRNEFVLDSAGRKVETFIYTRSSDGHNWVIRFKTKNVYEVDINGRQSSMVDYLWDENQEIWFRQTLTEYVFNASGSLLEEVRYRPASENTWRINSKTTYAYDLRGNLVLLTGFENVGVHPQVEWQGSSWKFMYEYNPEGNQTLFAQYTWDTPSNDWIFNRGDVNLYNGFGFKTTWIISAMNQAGTDSVVTTKIFFFPGNTYYTTYDSICDGESYQWQGKLFESGGTYQESFVSGMGNDSSYTLNLKVNPLPQSFEIVQIEESYFICQGQSLHYVAPDNPLVEYSWWSDHGEFLSEEDNDTVFFQWLADGYGELYVQSANDFGCTSDPVSIMVEIAICDGVDDQLFKGIELYPVPVKDLLQVGSDLDFLDVAIVDMNGREIIRTHKRFVDLSNLNSGLYVVYLRDRKGSLLGTRMIVKE